ncbi:thiazole synthase [Thermaerobacter marianensis]|uniref:thiazole synthase n=1 Tax=Thermaerobacter marianensis TaxID=73919 RepID=UPI003BF9C442
MSSHSQSYDPGHDPLVIAGRAFRSRLFVGTGKYRDTATMVAALERSGTEMVTVAIRAMNLDAPDGGDILAHVDTRRYHLLPNTAGATTADQAVAIAHLAREALGTPWIKLEVIGDPRTLLPDLQATLEATRRLVRDGFVVLPYCTSDLITCLRLEDAGAAAVMPLAAPIGTGQGMLDWAGIRRVIERVSVPVVVDAGLGVPSDAAMAMELGASAVLVNTAIARAQNPPLMAEAFKWGVLAGRQAFLAGRMPPQNEASPSSPTEGVPFAPLAARRAGSGGGGA